MFQRVYDRSTIYRVTTDGDPKHFDGKTSFGTWWTGESLAFV